MKIYKNLLISCSIDSTLKVWNFDNQLLKHTIGGLIDYQDLDIVGNKLMLCSRSGSFYIFDMDNNFIEIVKYVCDDRYIISDFQKSTTKLS